jgi:hypothetical protein
LQGISRNVSLTSTNNLSGVNFTITGVLNGSSVSEIIAGPNNNTVYTTQLFDVIVSVSVNAAVSNVSVGTGLIGKTHWFQYCYNRDISYFSVQVIVVGTINYSFNITSDDVKATSTPSLTSPIASLTNTNTTEFKSFPSIPFYYGNITINSSGSDGSLTIMINQSGGCN